MFGCAFLQIYVLKIAEIARFRNDENWSFLKNAGIQLKSA